MKSKFSFPPIGMRILKSAAAIAICYIVSFIRGDSGIVFYSQLASLWCIQVYVSNSIKNASQRFIGTIIGAVFGLIFLLFFSSYNRYLNAVFVSVFIVGVLYTTVVIKKKEASYFSCVVFLSIVVNHIGDVNPYLFVWDRFLDTVIGIAVGVCVNCFNLPRQKNNDILFISGLDDTLLYGNDKMSDYSRIELNRMLDEGLMFTISTMRTPASLLEPVRDIRLKLPVIAMDGAVLYDFNRRKYIHTYVISNSGSREILNIIEQAGLTCFINVIEDDVLEIFYHESDDEVLIKLVEDMRKSPLRNYFNSRELKDEQVIYFMLLYPTEIIENFYKILCEKGVTASYKVLKYKSDDYEGYSYIKIYNRNASKEHMIDYLKRNLGVEKTVTFGSIEGRYDVLIGEGDTNKVVREIKKRYEPLKQIGRK